MVFLIAQWSALSIQRLVIEENVLISIVAYNMKLIRTIDEINLVGFYKYIDIHMEYQI